MATWTKATLATRTLEHLGIVGTGQTADATQQSRMEEVVDSVYSRLRKKGLAPYPTTAITEEYQQPMVQYLAWKAGPRFGFSGPRLAELKAEAFIAEREMNEAAAAEPHREPVRVEYF